MAKDIHFEPIPPLTGKLSRKHTKVSFRKGVSGELHSYIYAPDKPVQHNELQQQSSTRFAQCMQRAKAILDDPEQRTIWQQRFDDDRLHNRTHYRRLQQYIAFSLPPEP